MTILVPTDFSKLSKVAVLYAVQIAKKLKADIILLAVINAASSSRALPKWKRLEEEMVIMAKDDAEQLISEIKKGIKGKIEISYRYILGFPVEDMIETFVTDNGVDMIVMGTKGASGLKKVVMGSNAAAVIDNSSVPVIAIPENAEYKTISKIAYASDLFNLHEEIKMVALFARLFDATVQVLHILPADSAKKVDKTMETDLIKISKYQKIAYHVLRNDSIVDALNTYIIDEQVDMLAMFTHKLDFYEKLFGKSVTRQLTFHAQVPLITFNKTTLL